MSGAGLLKKELPYNAEIEYLQSTGTQYINIPITASKNTFFGIEMGITPTGQNSTGDVIGVDPSSEYYINKYSYNSSTQNVVFASTIGGNSTNGGITISHGVKSTVNISTSGKTVNGTYTALTRQIRYDLTGLRIFASYRNVNRYPVRFHFIKVTAGSSLILDLIPVRKGTTGYMYDKVSGQLFGNDGTGAFTLGSDKT